MQLRNVGPLAQRQQGERAQQCKLLALRGCAVDVAQRAEAMEEGAGVTVHSRHYAACYFGVRIPEMLPRNEQEASRPVYVPRMPLCSDCSELNLISPATPGQV